MPTQRRFDGATLAAVLAKVEKDVGPSAKIVSAQKIRTGGFGGFFQRERFEVVVEPPVVPKKTVTVPEPSITKGTSVLDLANQVNESEKVVDQPVKRVTPFKAASVSRTPAAEGPKFPSGSQPRISTESDSFADVLSRIASHSDVAAETNNVSVPPSIPIADRPAILDAGSPLAPVTMIPEAALSHLRTTGPNIESAPNVIPNAALAKIEVGEVETTAVRTRITDSPLAALGLPPVYIPDDLDPSSEPKELQKVLVVKLESVPKAPEIRPSKGCVIAVVGDRSDALALAGELAQRWRRPKDEVVLASEHFKGRDLNSNRVLRNVRTAEDSQRSWQRRDRPTIVAIESSVSALDASWAEHILTALEPIATFGVTDATRKPEDILAWAQALGGVDCLSVNHIDATVSPAAVLATGIPVERIDGREATAAYWAILLAERLTAA